MANGISATIINRLNTSLIKVIRNPDIRTKLADQSAEVVTITPVQQDEFLKREKSRIATVVTQANIKLD